MADVTNEFLPDEDEMDDACSVYSMSSELSEDDLSDPTSRSPKLVNMTDPPSPKIFNIEDNSKFSSMQ